MIHSVRIKHAAELLRSGTGSVSGIGYLVGFESPNNFCRIFKREMKMTPTEFRKNASL